MPALQRRGLSKRCTPKAPPACLPSRRAAAGAAYRFLRRTEHALQYREDEQTHLLPGDPALRAALAAALGMQPASSRTRWPRTARFVSRTFRRVPPGRHGRRRGSRAGRCGRQGRTRRTVRAGRTDPSGLRRRGRRPAAARRHPDGQPPRAQPARRQPPPRRSAVAGRPARRAATPAPLQAAVRLFDLIETIAQRSAYLALLAEYPDTLARAWRAWWPPALGRAVPDPAPAAARQPIDRLAHAVRAAGLRPDRAPARRRPGRLPPARRRSRHRTPDEPDARRAAPASFQLLAQDLEGELTVEKLADQLSRPGRPAAGRNHPPRLAAGEPAAGRRAALRRDRLRQAGRQGTGLRLGPDLVFLFDDRATTPPRSTPSWAGA